jgi:ATP/maltotriose-dependent transcriptional regulator MalT
MGEIKGGAQMTRLLLLLAAGLGAAPSLAQPPGGGVEGRQPEIVVTGIRVQDFRDRLASCLARHCPPDEDIDATLALAEALFLNGDYPEGRAAVREALSRNRQAAGTYPEPVSDLYRAQTRLARHIGLDREARTAAHGILNALQEGIPQEDHRHFTARFEIAEIRMMSGDLSGAKRELEGLARVARAAGREDVATIAELRQLWYELVAYPGTTARSRLIEWSRLTAPRDRMRAIGAKTLLVRIYRSEGNAARADALLAEVGAASRAGGRRRLVYAPQYQLLQYETTDFGNVLNRLTENYEDKWIDVGFWILPNGRVSGLELMRSGAEASWAGPLLASIRGRLYSEGTEPTYRLERFTMTAGFETGTGSRIRHRGPGARVEYLDLTANEPERPEGSN